MYRNVVKRFGYRRKRKWLVSERASKGEFVGDRDM